MTAPQPPAHPFVEHVPMWRRVPASIWTGLVIGIVGLFVQVSFKTEVSDSSGYSCTYVNLAGYVVAAILVLTAVLGWVNRNKRPPIEQLPAPLMAALTVLFAALAVVHVLRGTGTIMSGCPS